MEQPAAQIIVTEQVVESGPSSILLFLIFVPTFVVAYLIPFIATIYARQNTKKWVFYWIAIMLVNLIFRPILNFIFGPYGGAFLYLVTAAGLVFVSSNEKANVMVEASDIVINMASDQWQGVREKLRELAKQYGLADESQ